MPFSRKQIETMVSDDARSFNDLDLSGCDLSGLEFTQRYFKRANLRGANLSGATFCQCEFKKADLTGANLTKADFSQCEFPEAVLDETVVERTTFSQCEFKRATWNGAKVKKAEFSQCDDVTGLPVEKVYATLWDMDDEAAKWKVCRERLSALAPILGGTVKERRDEDTIAWHGTFQGRAFRVCVDLSFGQPLVQMAATNRLGDLRLNRDPGRKAKAAPPDEWDEKDGSDVCFFLSDSVFLEAPVSELEWLKQRLETLPGPLYNSCLALLDHLKLQYLELADDWIQAEYKKDILQVNLAESVPMILAVFAAAAAHVEAARPVGPVFDAEAFAGAASAPCRYCGNAVPWGQVRCPSCGASL